MNPTLTHWTARDGKSMPFEHWSGAPPKPRAVVICVHGLSGAASDFWPIGESFPANGYAVYGMQLRGQGLDPVTEARGDIRSAREWRDDLLDFTALVRKRHPATPVFWTGESLGALIVIDAAAATAGRPDSPAGVILMSPVVALRESLKLPPARNLLLRAMLRFRPGKRISLESLGNSEVKVTSETTHRQQMQHTGHYVKDFTLRLFGQVERLVNQALPAARRISIPALVLYTPNDPLTSREGVETFIENLASPGISRAFFPASYHLILHDKDRALALRTIQDWLDARSENNLASHSAGFRQN